MACELSRITTIISKYLFLAIYMLSI